MKHLEIEAIVEKRLEKIDTAFNKARLQLNQDDIRAFRVKVKKLAAFLRLVNAAKAQAHPIKLPRKMLKVYICSPGLRSPRFFVPFGLLYPCANNRGDFPAWRTTLGLYYFLYRGG
jgi:hypothetical protein